MVNVVCKIMVAGLTPAVVSKTSLRRIGCAQPIGDDWQSDSAVMELRALPQSKHARVPEQSNGVGCRPTELTLFGGANPSPCTFYATIAHQVEHPTCNWKVKGSRPFGGFYTVNEAKVVTRLVVDQFIEGATPFVHPKNFGGS